MIKSQDKLKKKKEEKKKRKKKKTKVTSHNLLPDLPVPFCGLASSYHEH
jgi:hypothetical protein